MSDIQLIHDVSVLFCDCSATLDDIAAYADRIKGLGLVDECNS